MVGIYHMMGALGFLLALPVLPLVWMVSKKRRANLVQRLGFWTGLEKKKAGTRRIWVHALSVGEVRSAFPLVEGLAGSFAGTLGQQTEIVFTAATRTGFETARSLFCSKAPPRVSWIGYFPFDLWFSILRVARIMEPDLVCLVETDYWPGFLDIMKKKKIPVILVNARMSVSSFRGYARLGPLSALFFSSFAHVMAQTGRDRDRFKILGIPENRISVVGNMKFDQQIPDMDGAKRAKLKSDLGFEPEDRIWIAGSTHEGEEETILAAFEQIKKTMPDLRLILAPRDPRRCAGLAGRIPKKFAQNFWSACQEHPGQSQACDVVLMDILGILAASYAICDIAFIGGSLVASGGHNPLEPAAFGKPVLFGPWMTDFFEVADLLRLRQGAVTVRNGQDLAQTLGRILSDPELAENMGRAGRQIFRENSGAVNRTLTIMEQQFFG